ncbi:hypothetical protein BD408DRAFT_227017 [Parasitella parasitica]|nr:hypothetical protein BD408DRAFT_227017 [Parasitella parasitica]
MQKCLIFCALQSGIISYLIYLLKIYNNFDCFYQMFSLTVLAIMRGCKGQDDYI